MARGQTPQTPYATGVYTHPKPSPHAGGGLQFKTDHPKYYDLVLERAEEFSEVNPERNSPAFLGLRTKKNAAFSPKNGLP